ncbi:RNA polymerase sigma factor [Pelagibacterium mangrovi]|uniref:RNA polymerase sigma factor n=1 Tax=Pelagibacterium mangrovi TaxID=3119828 RepID=UPI002FCA6E0A
MPADIGDQIIAILPRLRAFALSLTRVSTDADDMVQAACERALRARDSYTPDTRFDAWMMRILHNLWVDTYRKRRREVLEDVTDPENDRPGEDGRRLVEDRSELSRTWDLMAAMPEEQRSVLTLVCVEGLSYRDTAEVLDVPVGTVMSRLARARIRLAEGLAQPNAATGRTAGTTR